MYLFYGFNRACIDRWDLRSGKLVWQSNRSDDGARTMGMARDRPFLMDQDRIVYAGARGIYSVRRKSGELSKVLDYGENHVHPTLLDGNLLIVSATPSGDSSECQNAKNCALWAVGLDKGGILWRHTLPKVTHRSAFSARFAGHLSAQGLSLVQVASAHEVVFDRLDLATGVSRQHQIIKTSSPRPPSIGWPAVQWRDDLFWLHDDGFLAVDPQSGTVRYRLE